ncbi:MAG TPA: methyltransferase domain-containing protein [Chitinophagaceae bacterium]|nr:methyltransferase domain-containing protein [Chitinophagaceae bacterium]
MQNIRNTGPQFEDSWNASLYDDRHGFVSKYGEDVVGWLSPQEGERVLDLGCGTGYLANYISGYGAQVTGIDKSQDMLEKARASYPALAFKEADATDFHFDQKFDAIFSNAVLHWVKDAGKVLACVYNSLAPGGRFVLEMGGQNNVKNIIDAVKKATKEEGLDDSGVGYPWYFPSVAQYTTLLEAQGFTVTHTLYFKRDTVLEGTEGMANWIKMFGHGFFDNVTPALAEKITARAVGNLRPARYYNNNWHADYVRLRVRAVKQPW